MCVAHLVVWPHVGSPPVFLACDILNRLLHLFSVGVELSLKSLLISPLNVSFHCFSGIAVGFFSPLYGPHSPQQPSFYSKPQII